MKLKKILAVVQVNSLTKEQEEHQAYKPVGSKAKHDNLKVSSTPTYVQ